MKRQWYHNVLSHSLILTIAGFIFLTHGQTPQLPILTWTPQPDWINVTDATYGAKGNNTADDAAAIQKAFDSLGNGGTPPKVIYFPPGTYRITKTLIICVNGNKYPMTILGCGRNTVISWAGTSDTAMALTHGTFASEFNGITWNGNGIARNGIFHNACGGMYEGIIRHENEAFLNFLGCGIRSMDPGDPTCNVTQHSYGSWNPTAETEIRNCLFSNCWNGIRLNWTNFFNWAIEGCEFRNCTVGVTFKNYASGYVRFCHFENSASYDVSMEYGFSNSIRWCTSVNAQRFVWGENVTIQDCAISGVKDKDSAIVLACPKGPFLVTDLFFSGWSSVNAPIVFNPAITHPGMYDSVWIFPGNTQKAVISNIRCDGTLRSGASSAYRGGDNNLHVTEIPAGNRTQQLFAASKIFFKSSSQLPFQKVFNVKKSGAMGNNSANDAAAIQKAVDSAQAWGNGAVVYFPTGVYKCGSTITISGSNFSLNGTGLNSRMTWSGTANLPIFLVTNAHHVTIKNLSFPSWKSSPKCTAIRQSPTTGASSYVTYDRINIENQWPPNYHFTADGLEGIVLNNLGPNDTAHIIRTEGGLRVNNSSEAIVLANFVAGVPIWIGGTKPKTGFVGVLNANGGNVQVYNNQDFVMGDQYVEYVSQQDSGNALNNVFMVQGGSEPAGIVTICGARLCMDATDSVFRVRNYNGLVSYWKGQHSPGNFTEKYWPAGAPSDAGYKFAQYGSNPVSILVGANTFVPNAFPEGTGIPGSSGTVPATFAVSATAKTASIENLNGNNSINYSGYLTDAARSLDHIRRLGGWALQLDYDTIVSFATPISQPAHLVFSTMQPAVHIKNNYLSISYITDFSVKLYDITGKQIANIANIKAGTVSFKVMATGVYVVKVCSLDNTFIRKIMMSR